MPSVIFRPANSTGFAGATLPGTLHCRIGNSIGRDALPGRHQHERCSAEAAPLLSATRLQNRVQIERDIRLSGDLFSRTHLLTGR